MPLSPGPVCAPPGFWRDQEVCDVVVAAERLVPIEQRLDAPPQRAGMGTERDDRMVDQLQAEILISLRSAIGPTDELRP